MLIVLKLSDYTGVHAVMSGTRCVVQQDIGSIPQNSFRVDYFSALRLTLPENKRVIFFMRGAIVSFLFQQKFKHNNRDECEETLPSRRQCPRLPRPRRKIYTARTRKIPSSTPIPELIPNSPALPYPTRSESPETRFPNLKPGRQLANGNHFLALFPCPETVALSGPSGVGLGGGGPGSLRGSAAEASAIGVGGKKPGRFRRILSSVLTCSCLSSRREAKNGAANRGAAAEGSPAAVEAGGNAQNGAYPRGAMEEGSAAVAGVGGQWQGGAESDMGFGPGVGAAETFTETRGGGGGEWRRGSRQARPAVRANARPDGKKRRVFGWVRPR